MGKGSDEDLSQDTSDTSIACPRCGTIHVRTGQLQLALVEPVESWHKTNHLLFVRPSLTKRPAVDIYSQIAFEFEENAPSWGLTHLNVLNPERILYRSFHQCHRYWKGGALGKLDGKRLIIVAYEPADGIELFLRGRLWASHLVLLARERYLRGHETYRRNADLVITDAPYGEEPINQIRLEDLSTAAPLIHHWVQSWSFDNNREIIRLFGDPEHDAAAGELVARGQAANADLLLVTSGAPAPETSAERSGAPSTRAVRRRFAERVGTAYIRLSMRHKYTGILANPNLTQAQRIDELLKRGLRVRTIGGA